MFKAQQWETSAAAYDSYLLINPKDKPGFQLNKIGQCFFNLQQYDKAIDAFKNLLRTMAVQVLCIILLVLTINHHK